MTIRTSPMVERVAKALYEHVTSASGDPFITRWEDLRVKYQDTWREQARTAIAAMQHPGQFVTMAGNRYFGCHPDDQLAPTAWQAMIEAALRDPAEHPVVTEGTK